MPRRVLIVSPHFPPVNAADHQRVRLLLPYMQAHGWEATVLAVQPSAVEAVQDPHLEKTLPQTLDIHRTQALSVHSTRRFGLGSLGLRCLPYLWKVGSRLLQQQKYDLIYFSTTIFTAMALGPYWKKHFGVPYVLDFQDPWLNDYYQRSGVQPPGGKLKYQFSQWQAKQLEPSVVRQASHIISVSPSYPLMLQKRYSALSISKFTVLPFGASKQDFEVLGHLEIQQHIFDPHDGYRHWVYVGRGGEDMAFSLKALFSVLARLRACQFESWGDIRLHFIGTSYAPAGQGKKTIEPLATSFGLGAIVREYTDRLPYFEALQCLKDAHALIVPGSDDPQYTASKIYPYLLARKPLLAIFNEASSVVQFLKQLAYGKIATFTETNSEEAFRLAQQVEGFLLQSALDTPTELDLQAFEPYTAQAMARQHCRIFNTCLVS